MDDHSSSRRTVLGTIAGLAVSGIAGCSSARGGSEDGVQEEQEILSRVAVEGTSLVVELTETADIDQINVIQPDGQLFRRREVSAGVRRIDFELGTSYQPGDYTIIVLNNSETVVKTTLNIDPDVHILGAWVGENTTDKIPDEMNESPLAHKQAVVEIENRGTGPEAITKLLVLGDVPNPSGENGTNYVKRDDISGIRDPNGNLYDEVEEMVVAAGEQTTIYSSRIPFGFIPGGNMQCESYPQSGQVEILLETKVDSKRISKPFVIEYTPSEEWNSCSIVIEEI